MKTHLIAYELDQPGQEYHPLTTRLKSLGAAKIQYSEWILRSASSASDVRDDLKRFIDSNDSLLVAVLTGEAAWANLMVTNDQFKKLIAASIGTAVGNAGARFRRLSVSIKIFREEARAW